MRRVTINDIAKECHTSKATVSYVINEKYNKVSEEMVERVQRAIRELGYVPNLSAKSLAGQGSNLIGVIIPQMDVSEKLIFDNPFYSEFLSGMEYYLRKAGYGVVISVVTRDNRFEELVKKWNLDGAVVFGVDSDKAKKILTKLYKPFLINNFRVIFMDIPSAEMTKYAANSMLATRISFMNDIANLCELVGADVDKVRAGIGSDTRIGRKFLYAGCGYGGSCFPKDVKALIKTADDNGYSLEVLKAVEHVNEKQKMILFNKLEKAFHGETLSGKCVALWGLAFKPETDDMRESTALVIIRCLLDAGCTIKVYDPEAMNECRRIIGDKVTYCTDMYNAAIGADALMMLTEWKEFRLPNWDVVGKSMNRKLLLDGRNIYDKDELIEHGFEYHCIGK